MVGQSLKSAEDSSDGIPVSGSFIEPGRLIRSAPIRKPLPCFGQDVISFLGVLSSRWSHRSLLSQGSRLQPVFKGALRRTHHYIRVRDRRGR